MRIARVLSLAVPVLLVLTGCPTQSGSDPCLDVTCGAGSCVPTNGQAQCICNTGYVAKGLKCEQATTEDVCQNSPCSAFPGKVCQAVNGFPNCLCPETTFEVDGGCVPSGPCAPNPCRPDGGDPNRTVCNEVSGAPVCSCNPGHAPTLDGGCNTEKVFDCAFAHDGGFNDDQYEPDECPSLARTYDLSTSLPETHTIGPASDADWFKVSAPALHIIDVSLSSTTNWFWIDVYKPDGVTQIASARNNTSNPTVRFQFSGETHLLVRIRGYSSVTTGSYTIVMSDVGVDDFTNDHTQSLALQPGGNFSGNIQYAGDVDIVKTQVPNGKTYQYNIISSTPFNIVVDALEPDGTTIRKTMSRNSSSLYTHTSHGGASGKEVFLKAHGTSSSVTGLFDLSITDLGIDDHGDVIHDATSLAVSGGNVQGVLERTGDLDVFKVTTQAGKIYRFNCAVNTVSCAVDIRDEGAQSIAYLSQGSGTTTSVSAKAITAGVWYVLVSYSSSTPGTTYTYRLEDLGTNDDHSDTSTGATSINVGTATSGNIEASNDRDFFQFSATAQHTYEVTCASTPSSVCSQFRIVNAAGTQVGSWGYGTTSPAAANITSTGTYFVEVVGSTSTGAYSITVNDMGIDTGDTISSASAISVGTAVNGQISGSTDEDWYSFSVTAGKIYKVTCTSTAGTSSYPCYGRITTSSGSTLYYLTSPTTGNYYGNPTEVTLTPSANATYYIRMDYYASSYTYSVTVTDLGTDDHPNSSTGATNMTVGQTANGNLQYAGDVDYLQFTPQANRIYKVVCAATPTNICEVLVQNQSSVNLGSGGPGSSVTVNFGSSSATTISIRVSSSSSGTGAYTLTLTDEGGDDHPNQSTGASGLTLSTGSTGNIQYSNDLDYFAYATTANHFYRVTCTSTVSGICRIRVYDNNGSLVTSTATGLSTSATFVSPSGGTYAFEISGLSSGTGSYTVTLYDDGTDDHPNTSTGATVLTTASNTTGVIQYTNDVDMFTVSATQGTIYTVTCTTTTNNSCYISVRDPSASLITSNGPGTNIPVSWRALSSGNYTVEVRSWNAPATGGDSYTLALTTAVDDHGDTPSTASPVTFGATTNAGLQYGGDVDAFSWTATVGRIYQVTCTSTNSSLCRLTVADATGGQIGNVVGPGTSVTASYKAISGGTNSVRVYSSSGSATGSYTLVVTETQDDHGDTIGTATGITAGAASATAAIQFGADLDVFSFQVTTTMKIYQFSCTATGTTPPQVCGIRLRNAANGTVQTQNAATSNNLVYTFSSTGTYYFEVYGNGTAVGSYTYQLQDLGTDDHGNSAPDASGLTVGAAPTNGTMEIGADRDFFSFNATQGNGYKVRCTSSSSSLCRFTVRDPSSGVVGSSSYGPSMDTVMEFTALVAGTYTIEVSSSNASGTYQIQVALEDGGTYQTATSLTPGVSYGAYMSGSADQDWFTVTLGAGNHTVALPTGNYYMYTTIFDSTGVATGTAISGGSRTIQYPTTSSARSFNGSGTYYIRVEYYISSSIGPYSIQVQ